MTVNAVPRPGFDAELRAGLAVVGGMFPPTITPELIDFMRLSYASPPMNDLFRQHRIDVTDVVLPGYQGGDLTAAVLRPRDAQGPRPTVLYAHSGGLMFGDKFSGLDLVLDWVSDLGAIVITFDYRLAPEFPDPYPWEDMYAALEWVAAEAGNLGVRRDRILVAGASAGGGLAAGIALAARDRGGPRPCGQLLDYPMLDDRLITASTGQFDGVGVWDRVSNQTAWQALLGDRRGGDDVSAYAAPARAGDLSALPPAFIDVGAAEIFRDEAIDYAGRIWAAGAMPNCTCGRAPSTRATSSRRTPAWGDR